MEQFFSVPNVFELAGFAVFLFTIYLYLQLLKAFVRIEITTINRRK